MSTNKQTTINKPTENSTMNLNAPINLKNQRARAAEYIKRGWSPIPVKLMGEEPLHSDWQNLRTEEKDIDRLFPDEPTNIGVRLGKASGGLVDLHFVDKDALRFAPDFLRDEGMTFGPASARSSHRLFRMSRCEPCKWGAAGIGTIVELRGDGQMTVFPGSIHESGEPITFERPDDEPDDFSRDWLEEEHWNGNDVSYLKDRPIQIPVATVLYKRWKSEDRSSLVQSVTKLLWGLGWPDMTIVRLIRVVEREAGTSGQEKACQAVFKETSRPGLSGLADCLGEETVRDIENWDSLQCAVYL
jgi:hypothetical protein